MGKADNFSRLGGSPDFRHPWPTLPKGALCYVSCPTALKAIRRSFTPPLQSTLARLPDGRRVHLRIKIHHMAL